MDQVELTVEVLPTTINRIEAIQEAFEEHEEQRPTENMIVDMAVEELYDLAVGEGAEWWDETPSDES